MTTRSSTTGRTGVCTALVIGAVTIVTSIGFGSGVAGAAPPAVRGGQSAHVSLRPHRPIDPMCGGCYEWL